MSISSYRLSIGTFECVVVSDGTNVYPSPAPLLFVGAPPDQLRQALHEYDLDPDQWPEWVATYRALVICTGEHQVLVDTGAGSYAPDTGHLIPNLRAEAIPPEVIDTVVLTHAHPDHIGGNLQPDGKPAFPNARYVVPKEEWAFWTSEPDLSRLPIDQTLAQTLIEFAQANLAPVMDAGQLEAIDADAEIVPGIRAVPAAGHTPGQIAVSASSGGESLLYASDALIHPLHLQHPEWYCAVDLAPAQAMRSGRELLAQAAADGAFLLAPHFPFPGLGRVTVEDENYVWQPVGTPG
jgi:glyoxylase-like metal-dependent hydrolase (beta-lactamase superfamily II)